METYIVFYDPTGKELCAYTAQGTFAGELQSTRELLAYENGFEPQDIKIKAENR